MTSTTPPSDRVGSAPWCPRPLAYAVGMLSVLATLWISLQLSASFGATPPLMAFLIPIALGGCLGGWGPGVLATAAAALLTDYFLLPPAHSFQIAHQEDALRLTLLILTGSMLSVMSETMHRSGNRAEESRRRYAVTLASIGEAVITTDKQGRITLLNGEAERLTGWSNQEAWGRPLTAVFHILNEENRTPREDPVQQVLQSGRVVGLANHTILVAKDGREILIEDNGSPIKQDDGKIIGVVLVFHDCTERKKAGDALTLFRTLIDRIQDGIEVVDPVTGRFLDVNENTCVNLGYTHEEMLALTVQDIDPLVTPAMREETLKQLRESGSVVVEGVHRRKDGTMFPVELNKQLVSLHREYIVVVARDITERKQSEQMLEFIARSGWAGRHEDFLARLVGHLGQALGVDYVFVGRLKDSGTVRTIGLFARGRIVPDIEYPLRGTPCHNVVGRILCHYGERLQEMFPADRLLAEMGAQSFLGIPLTASTGRAVGLLAILDGRSMPNPRPAAALLKIAAIRAAGELERLSADTALRESEELYRSLISASPDAVTVASVAGLIEFTSPRALEIFGGAAKKRAIGRSLLEWVVPEDRERARASLSELLAGAPLRRTEYELLRSDDARFTGEVNAAVLRSADGSPKGLLFITRDITQRKQAVEMQKRLAMAVEQATEDIIITDDGGKIIYVNPAFERNTGYLRAKVIGCNPRILKSGAHEAAFYQSLWDTLKRGEVWSGHIINKKKDGELFEEEATISPIRDAAGRITNYVAVKRDVTREVALETQLRQSQKLEAIGRLAGGIAHDFNNLLTVIRGNASLWLLGHESNPAYVTDCAQQIVEAAERAANLTRQLLMFSRQQAIQSVRLDLNDVVERMTLLLHRVLGEDVSLIETYAAGLPAIQADAGMIEQILLNLAVNSRDAMPAGGKLTITTGTEVSETATAGRDISLKPEIYVRLTVTDTGAGIAPEVLPHIFEPFFSTKEVGKGTGLGLATVHGIVLQHNGTITVNSELGRGTTFNICFPALAGETAEKTGVPIVADLPGGSETLLVVEDEYIVRQTVSAMLSRFGYTVVSAASGREALTVWQKERDRIQLLLTDIVMPDGMTGFDLAQQLQNEKRSLKVIFTSGYSGDMAENRVALIEGTNFLQKPYAPSKLAAALRANLDPAASSRDG